MPVIPGMEVPQVSIVMSCSIVLLVEGMDDIKFFDSLLRYMGVNPGADVDLREVGGKDKFRHEFPAFLNDPHFSQVKAYAIIRDADNSAPDALKSVQGLLKKHDQPCPTGHARFAHSSDDTLKVGVYIMPGGPKGMLEDLCLQSVKDHLIMPHVKNFMDQVQKTMGKKAPKNPSKATVQAFLSGMHNTVCGLGVAAQQRTWRFDNEAFSNLRNFLEQLVQEEEKSVPDVIGQENGTIEDR